MPVGLEFNTFIFFAFCVRSVGSPWASRGVSKWYYRSRFLRRCYQKLVEIVSGFCERRMYENITLTNSLWMRRVIEQVYGIHARVVYPPVKEDFPYVPFEERENGFVCVGRISPEKRLETVIDIVACLKKFGLMYTFTW